jgi:hypothetical protein
VRATRHTTIVRVLAIALRNRVHPEVCWLRITAGHSA